MDQELVAYFDRRFSELKTELKSELKSGLKSELIPEIRAEIASSADTIKSELRAEIAAGVVGATSALRVEIAASVAGATSALRAEIAARAAETRRHFDVVADRLMDKIQLVGEGVITVDEKLDRFRGEVADEFRRVDRRLLRLEARTIG